MAKAVCQETSGQGEFEPAGSATKKDDRQRAYAGVIYPESARSDWMERLDATHTQALVSPLHDKDTNPDGSLKKSHYHWLQFFEGKKSREQLIAMWKNIAGEDISQHFEEVGSKVGYARYLTHMDNPEKAQYDPAEVRSFGGIDYKALIETTRDKKKMYQAMGRYIIEHGITSLAHFSAICLESNLEWYDAMTIGRSYYFDQLIKDLRINKKDLDIYGRLVRLETVVGLTGLTGGQPVKEV